MFKVFLDRSSLRKLGIGLGAAFEVVIYTMSGYAVGTFLDGRVERAAPWFTVVFTLAGSVLGFYRLYKVFQFYEEQDKRESKDGDRDSSA